MLIDNVFTQHLHTLQVSRVSPQTFFDNWRKMSYKAGQVIIFISFSVAILGVSILKDRKGEYVFGWSKKREKLNQNLTFHSMITPVKKYNDNYTLIFFY